MKSILRMRNTIQEYAWGSHTAIAELLGQPVPSDRPQAEMWMGAHPKAPSMVFKDGDWHPLNGLISTYTREVLGEATTARFGGRLPYLFKVLAAARPLSIQAHPSLKQAREGFARENREGIPLAAPDRNYRDDNHKPEIICALTPFWALCGFRSIDAMRSLFSTLGITGLESELNYLKTYPGQRGRRQFLESVMSLEGERKTHVTASAVKNALPHLEKDPVFRWIVDLNDAYPGDIGILAPLMLNLICLKPRQAMFLGAGELHAYLEGTGIELMANSDNVLRGGLTPKHIDVPELLNVLTFETRRLSILEPQRISETEDIYPSGAREFVLSGISLTPGDIHHSGQTRSIEMLLCVDGEVTLAGGADETSVCVQKGTSVLVPAAAAPYIIKGNGELFKAAVPL
ncbi:Mannose-6-phosphate isomerase (EC [Olavius algarvensis associated proteobacterium Delta 3]|nr:Mannose-6-phosphate isomerase (EC [Olavius algarvensis associated proteobacterium Delta 3]